VLELNEADRAEIGRLMRHAPKPHIRLKATAIWNLSRGKRLADVAEFLGVSQASIRAWAKRFCEEGAAGFEVKPGRGRPVRACAEEIEQILRQSPRAFNLNQTRWTLRALAKTAPSLRGFSDMGVSKALARLGYRYKRGQPHLHSPDPDYEAKRGSSWQRFEKSGLILET